MFHTQGIYLYPTKQRTDNISLIWNEEEKSFKAFKRKYCKISHSIEYLAIVGFKSGRKKSQLSKQNKPKPRPPPKAPAIRDGTLSPCFTAQGV